MTRRIAIIEYHYRLLVLITLLLFSQSSNGFLLEKPLLRWTYRLPSSGTLAGPGIRQGNQVVPSSDGEKLFVTSDDGNLHIISLADQDDDEEVMRFVPASIQGRYTECTSGISFVDREDGAKYVLYTVIDIPITAEVAYDDIQVDDSSELTTTSRLLAVNYNGSLRWDINIDGVIVGNPVVGNMGSRIYVVHNVMDDLSNRGKVSVISDDGGERPTIIATVGHPEDLGAFGAPSGRVVKINDSYVDVFMVAESGDGYGYGERGHNYVLVPSPQYEELNGQGSGAYLLQEVSQWEHPSVARPTLNSNGTAFWMGGSKANVAGWATGITAPFWETSTTPSDRNESQPIMSAPVLSLDDSNLYLAGTNSDLYCIDALTGETIWTDTGDSSILTEPQIFEIDNEAIALYAIETMNGKLRQYDPYSGNRNWEFDCSHSTGIPSCQDSVEAEFSLSNDGNMLYYGDIFGRVHALQVALFITPAPTSSPITTSAPTPVVVVPVVPVSVITNTDAPTDEAIMDPSTFQPTFQPTPQKREPAFTRAPFSVPPVTLHPIFNIENEQVDAIEATDESQGNDLKKTLITVLCAAVGAIGFLVIFIFLLTFFNRNRHNKMMAAKQREEQQQPPPPLSSSSLPTLEPETIIMKPTEQGLEQSYLPGNLSSGFHEKSKSSKRKKAPPVAVPNLDAIEEASVEHSIQSEKTVPKKQDTTMETILSEYSTTHSLAPDDEISGDIKQQGGGGNALTTEVLNQSNEGEKNPADANILNYDIPGAGFTPLVLDENEVEIVSVTGGPLVLSKDAAKNQTQQQSLDTSSLVSVDSSLYIEDESDAVSASSILTPATEDPVEVEVDVDSHFALDLDEHPLPDHDDCPEDELLSPGLQYNIKSDIQQAGVACAPPPAPPRETNTGPASHFLNSTGDSVRSRSEPATGVSSPSETQVQSSQSFNNTNQISQKSLVARAGRSVRRVKDSPFGGGPSGSFSEQDGFIPNNNNNVSDEKKDESKPSSLSDFSSTGKQSVVDETEAAWNSFLKQLAEAEKQFFNPVYATPRDSSSRSVTPPPPQPPAPND